eukprot:gene2924-3642_t
MLTNNSYNISTTSTTTTTSSNEEIIKSNLKKYFGLSSFRPNQYEAIYNTIVKGSDTYVSVATGGGKSLMFQLPSVILSKTTIVVSPLISLMDDQILKLSTLGIKAIHLSSKVIRGDRQYNGIRDGDFRLVYITPERLLNSLDLITTLYEQNSLCLFAIDECHCVSQWGFDFRPVFRLLSVLRQQFTDIPIMALTATSTPEIEKDVKETLLLRNPLIIRSSRNRPNIFYKSIFKVNETEDFKFILKMIKDVKQNLVGSNSTIIYCPTIKIADELNSYLSGTGNIKSSVYHSKITDKQRQKVHKDFVYNNTEVIVATIAFGMGIDKPDIRLIIHYGPSNSVEEYYQESGRAGRDGLPSLSLVFFSKMDFVKGQFRATLSSGQGKEMTAQQRVSKLCQLKNYLVNKSDCRRKLLLDALGEDFHVPQSDGGCQTCDNCTEDRVNLHQIELGAESLLIVKCIQETSQRYGIKTIVSILRGSKSEKDKFGGNQYFGKGAAFSEKWWKELASVLKQESYLEETTSFFFRITKISTKGWELIKQSSIPNSNISVLLPTTKILNSSIKITKHHKQISNSNVNNTSSQININTPTTQTNNSNLYGLTNAGIDPNASKLFSILIEFRSSLSNLLDTPPFLLFSEKSLRLISLFRPTTLDNLRLIDGLEEKRIIDQGSALILKVKEFCKDNNIPSDLNSPSKPSTQHQSPNHNNININNKNNNSPPKAKLSNNFDYSQINNISTVFEIIKGFGNRSTIFEPKSNQNNENDEFIADSDIVIIDNEDGEVDFSANDINRFVGAKRINDDGVDDDYSGSDNTKKQKTETTINSNPVSKLTLRKSPPPANTNTTTTTTTTTNRPTTNLNNDPQNYFRNVYDKVIQISNNNNLYQPITILNHIKLIRDQSYRNKRLPN